MRSLVPALVDVVGRFDFCTGCKEWREDVKMRRQNTAYVDDTMNWVLCCSDCLAWLNECWAERWAEYHAGVL